jgi:ferredoxin--NADP+ reductase
MRSVRSVSELPKHELLGDDVCDKPLYYPTVMREPFRNQGQVRNN